MKIKNKIYVLGAISLLSIGLVGCNNNKDLNTNSSTEVSTVDKNTEEKAELKEYKEFNGLVHYLELTGSPSKKELLSLLGDFAKIQNRDDMGYVTLKVKDNFSHLELGLVNISSNMGIIMYSEDSYIDNIYEKDYNKKPTKDEGEVYKEFIDYLVKDNHSIESAFNEVCNKHSMDKDKVTNILNKCFEWETSFKLTDEYVPTQFINDKDVFLKRTPIVEKKYSEKVLKVEYDVIVKGQKTTEELKAYAKTLNNYILNKYGTNVEVKVYFFDEYASEFYNLGAVLCKDGEVRDNLYDFIDWNKKPTAEEYNLYKRIYFYENILKKIEENPTDFNFLDYISEKENISKEKITEVYDKCTDWELSIIDNE